MFNSLGPRRDRDREGSSSAWGELRPHLAAEPLATTAPRAVRAARCRFGRIVRVLVCPSSAQTRRFRSVAPRPESRSGTLANRRISVVPWTARSSEGQVTLRSSIASPARRGSKSGVWSEVGLGGNCVGCAPGHRAGCFPFAHADTTRATCVRAALRSQGNRAACGRVGAARGHVEARTANPRNPAYGGALRPKNALPAEARPADARQSPTIAVPRHFGRAGPNLRRLAGSFGPAATPAWFW